MFIEKRMDKIYVTYSGRVFGVEVSFPNFTRTDACKIGDFKCPVAANRTYSYLTSNFVDLKYPKVIIFYTLL